MEPDRYRANHKLYVLGIISLLLSLSLLAFSLYITPRLLLGWKYDSPEFLMHMIDWLQRNYQFTEVAAAKIILLMFFILALLFGIMAYIISNRVDNQIYGIEEPKESVIEQVASRRNISESMGFGLKVFLIIIVVILLAILFEWTLRSTAPGPIGEGRQYVR